jgi:hypothetical protein
VLLLGGEASPIGWSVQYIEASPETVVEALREIHCTSPVRVLPARPYPEVLEDLTPFEAPWTRELVMPCGRWTAYLNNFTDGGDSSAVGPALARWLEIRCVVAQHTPRYGPGHEATQMWVLSPDGEPPLMYRRTVSAVATDGRWEWDVSGAPFEFEDQSRYSSRRIRDRFDRVMLLDYLGELGIPAANDAEYGPGIIVQQVVDWPRYTVTLEEARKDL